MPQGNIVRVMKASDDYQFWVAVAGSTDEAIETVRRKLPKADQKAEIGVLRERASAETVERLGLGRGEAWRL